MFDASRKLVSSAKHSSNAIILLVNIFSALKSLSGNGSITIKTPLVTELLEKKLGFINQNLIF